MSIVEFANLAARLSLGEAQIFRALTVVPLIDPSRRPTGYLTLDEALASGAIEITEVSEGGRVPELKLLNPGARPVFLLDGDLRVSTCWPGRTC